MSAAVYKVHVRQLHTVSLFSCICNSAAGEGRSLCDSLRKCRFPSRVFKHILGAAYPTVWKPGLIIPNTSVHGDG
ncbi:hypothetical protein HHUSO_G27815 [Huso huso]|uniref:Secreted protein n=1 Tax=Huso huso TaxID=61971 RepID=A0ABR0YKI0_HUSHU